MKDSSRTSRQLEIVQKFADNKGRGTLLAATGFGKTFTAIMVILRLLKSRPEAKVIIVVPTINLKNQWIVELRKNKVKDHCDVIVINTAYKSKAKCDLLICDEMHAYGAEQFIKVFDKITYQFIFGLTATIERTDGMHEVLLQYAPVIDEVPIEECHKNGWVSDYLVYNLAVPMLEDETEDYDKANKQFRYAAGQIGFGGSQSFNAAKRYLNDKDADPHKRAMAAIYYNAMRKRGDICKNSQAKIPVIKALLDKFDDRKALLFSASTKFADDVQEELGDICLSFHSKRTKKQQVEILKKFKDGRTKQRIISSVKALNAGFDVPDCSLGIVAAGSSKKLDNIQRTGRIIRYVPGKTAVIINLYAPNTQEVSWLNKRQEGQIVKWVDTIDEITV
jgi:superfamily II DNA or RNA helicase|tara:strand:+ start:246 stop:1421 length:1176 start_codon:yes stop_codon:yes gene_type:complete